MNCRQLVCMPYVLCLLFLIFLLSCPGAGTGRVEAGDDSSFYIPYSVYNRLTDTDRLSANISHSAMSGSGKVIAFFAVKHATKKSALYTISTDGGRPVEIPVPDLKGRGIAEVIINRDGSRIFFSTAGLRGALYKAEKGKAEMIYDASGHTELEIIEKIQCTHDGQELYFLNRAGYSGDVWKISHDGRGLTKVIEDTDIKHGDAKGGKGYRVTDFGISDSAGTMTFILQGYFDRNNIHIRHDKPELFVFKNRRVRQLTNEKGNFSKTYLAISGNGEVTTYLFGVPHNKWISVATDSGKLAELASARGSGAAVLNFTGTRLLLVEDGGRHIQTDGSGFISLLPVSDMHLAIQWSPSISDDGTRISFRFGYSSWPFKEALYVGHLLDAAKSVGGSPVIQNISFDPNFMATDPGSNVKFTAEITDPQGPEDVKRVRMDQLVKGIKATSSYVPASFYWWPNDEGLRGDGTAGDSMYTSTGSQGPKIKELGRMTVRIGAMDGNGNMAVAYAELGIGSVIAGQPAADEPAVLERDETYSPDQKEIADIFGHPDMFRIAYLPFGEDGKHLARYETWTYIEHMYEITFVAGDILRSGEITGNPDIGGDGVQYSGLRPGSFDIDMNLSAVAGVIGSSDFQRIESLIEGFEEKAVEIYLGKNVLFYIQDGYLLYLETFGTERAR